MILRFKLYSMAGASALLATNVDAFTAQKPTTLRTTITSRNNNKQPVSSSTRLHQLSPGWDNDDFMAALGGGDDAIEKANADYQKQSDNKRALDDWRYQQAMGEQPTQPPPQSMPVAAAPPPAQFFDANGNPVVMPTVYDANGNPIPFNPAMQQPPPPPVQQPPQAAAPPPAQQQPPANAGAVPQFQPNVPNALEPPLPVNPKSASVDPRPTGFNTDAYTMSNTADVYFAQLKQDSKVRKYARLRGDKDVSEAVFGDSSVKAVGDSWNQNPYTLEKNIAEARAEIEGTVRMHAGEPQFGDRVGDPKASSGISYKEKLEQMKASRGVGGGAAPKAAKAPVAKAEAPAVEVPPVAKVEAPLVEVPPVVAAVVPQIETPKVAAVAPPPPQPKVAVVAPPPPQPKVAVVAPPPPQPQVAAVAPPPPQPKVAVVAPPPPQPKVAVVAPPPPQPKVAVAPPAAVATVPPPAALAKTVDEDEVRRQVRTLQGLLLKQRGGPGFGAGRLKAPEAQRLENTLEDVLGILRSEAGVAKPEAAVVVDAVVEAPVAPKPVVPVATKPVAVTPPPPAETTPPAQAAAQAATTASISTPSPPPPRPITADPLAGSIACVEAVLNMYKSAPTISEKEALMTPLRDALMAAASASNKSIAEGELDAHRKAMDEGPAAASAAMTAVASPQKPAAVEAQPMMGFPTSYEVTKPDEASAPAAVATDTITSTASGEQAGNTKKLEEVYTALVNARDDSGTLGLKNMSGNEADDLADKLVTMRGVLLDELN